MGQAFRGRTLSVWGLGEGLAFFLPKLEPRVSPRQAGAPRAPERTHVRFETGRGR